MSIKQSLRDNTVTLESSNLVKSLGKTHYVQLYTAKTPVWMMQFGLLCVQTHWAVWEYRTESGENTINMTAEISHRKSIQIADTEFVHHMVPHNMGVIKKHLQAIERIKKKG